jgi:hypothetical protein
MFRHSSFRILAASAAVTAFSTSGSAVFAQNPLPPNTFDNVIVPVVPTGMPPYQGTLLLELESPIFATNGISTIDGFVTSSVFRNTSDTLDFLYQFRFSSLSDATVASISIASYKDVQGVSIAQTAEDIDGATGLAAENAGGAVQNFFREASSDGGFRNATRPGINGDGINANLTTGIAGEKATFTLIVRTSATDYSVSGSSSVQGSGISAFTRTAGAIAPFSVTSAPEPGSMALLAAGLLPMAGGLALRRRRAQSKWSV